MPRRRVKKALTKTQQRKKEHLELCLDPTNVSGRFGTGLDRYSFVHNALPDLDIDEIERRYELPRKTAASSDPDLLNDRWV